MKFWGEYCGTAAGLHAARNSSTRSLATGKKCKCSSLHVTRIASIEVLKYFIQICTRFGYEASWVPNHKTELYFGKAKGNYRKIGQPRHENKHDFSDFVRWINSPIMHATIECVDSWWKHAPRQCICVIVLLADSFSLTLVKLSIHVKYEASKNANKSNR